MQTDRGPEGAPQPDVIDAAQVSMKNRIIVPIVDDEDCFTDLFARSQEEAR
jgi:hypothetical protein